nr:MAG TPA: hypothetical protein [Caudoviricetes sp.]
MLEHRAGDKGDMKKIISNKFIISYLPQKVKEFAGAFQPTAI